MSLEVESPSVTRSQYSFKAMGGEFQLMCFPQSHISREEVTNIFKKAQLEVQRIEEKFTDFKDSAFNEINKFAGKKPVAVDKEIWNLVRKANQIAKNSNGIFDISFASVGHMWRKAKAQGRTLSFLERQQGLALIDYRKIRMNRLTKTIFLPHEDMRIGLGGIGKGYAVDRVFELLKHEGLSNFYVNGSGDIRVHSHESAPRPWRIGIRNPLSKDSSKSIGVLQLTNGSVASSGGYIQFNPHEKERADHHIINPRDGLSGNELIASTVLAEDTITADTTATILMNLDTREAISYLDKLSLLGFVIDNTGKTHLSELAIKSFGI